MSETLEPRQVEKPFLGRWIRTTFALLASSPATFGAVVAALAVFDLLYIDVVPRSLGESGLTLVVGAVLLPAFWIAMSLLSRRADRAVDRSELPQLAVCGRTMSGALLPGCLLASVNWLLHWALSASPAIADAIGSYTLNFVLLVAPMGVCYFPLMALVPDLSIAEAWRLSRTAARLNDEWIIVTFVAVLSVGPDVFARAVPAGLIVTAAFLVFVGVFNYVAYRDIFERRPDYATESVFAARARPHRYRRPADTARQSPVPDFPRADSIR